MLSSVVACVAGNNNCGYTGIESCNICSYMVVYDFRVHHYSIERQPDGMVMIQDGKKFIGPIELVQHHEKVLDGFLTKPTIPCERQLDQQPMAWPLVTMFELEQALIEKAMSMKLTVCLTMVTEHVLLLNLS